MQHHYVERDTRQIKTEQFYSDQAVQFLYSRVREQSSWLFHKLTSARISRMLSYVNYDGILSNRMKNYLDIHKQLNIDYKECFDAPENLDSLRKIFERKIRYWECRSMPNDPCAIVSPADSRMLCGSFQEESGLFIKDKFFDYEEMFGPEKNTWLTAFRDGDFAVFRLTPEKYHYNHTPVAGKIIDFYSIQGTYHACNPHAVVSVVTPYSKNKRIVSIIDTDVEEGTKAGLVAMIEVVALMIGDIVQCYSKNKYDSPLSIGTGMFVKKGAPKSLFRPGSSTVVLIFQKNRVRFADDIVANMSNPAAESIYSRDFGKSLIETDIKVRSFIASSRNK
ncbi:MAG: phosphatidylserine decarboxylase [Deltaproteobacteria bacterium HGW-Deltaproteobacteria-12]|jgi:phosphatidylserine decarboxylase|nr:MAG: phosphatidylserine decarboxylase [Deltaproteobacteria bacterium HGW-Deltaproteobacteria-12]